MGVINNFYCRGILSDFFLSENKNRISYCDLNRIFFKVRFFLIIIFLIHHNESNSQVICDSITPNVTIDLTGNPSGYYDIVGLTRAGLCCGAKAPYDCISATITIDSNAAALQFSITGGATPNGSLYYQVGCDTPKLVGELSCLSGIGPHILTFCKPGGNQNDFRVTSIPKVRINDSLSVNNGCSVLLGTLGLLEDSSLVWNDITSADKRYNAYLNCIAGCDTVTFTPDYNAPSYIDYQICGNLYDTICSNNSSTICDTVRVYVNKIIDTSYHTVCSNDSFTLPGGVVPTVSGTYIDTLSSSLGCDSIIVSILDIKQSKNTFISLTSCDSLLVNGTMYYSSQTVRDSFTSHLGCDSLVITDLTINPTVDYIQQDDVYKCYGDTIQIILHSDSIDSYNWDDGDISSRKLISDFGSYVIEMTDVNKCIIWDTILVLDANCPPCSIYVPNAFTPNFNNLNERFKPITDCQFLKYNLQIFNRWGEKLFETSNPSTEWNGNYLGKPCQQGAYLWILYGVDIKSKFPHVRSGTVTILR